MADTHLLHEPAAFRLSLSRNSRRNTRGRPSGSNWSVARSEISHQQPILHDSPGLSPKGIVGAGTILEAPKRDHYDPDLAAEGKKLNFVDLKFESLNVMP